MEVKRGASSTEFWEQVRVVDAKEEKEEFGR